MKICVLIPIFNEARAIGAVVEQVRKQNVDVLVIDDGSTDGSGAIAKDKGATVLRNEQKSGKGGALKTGFAYLRDKGYDAIVTMDGDGQHDPFDLHKFTKADTVWPVGIISGNRMANPRGMPPVRFLTNKFMSSLISRICRQPIPDSQCGYRLIHTDVLKTIDICSNDFEVETEVLIKASKKNFPIHSVPIQTIYRDEDSKINPIIDTIRFFSFLIREVWFKKYS